MLSVTLGRHAEVIEPRLKRMPSSARRTLSAFFVRENFRGNVSSCISKVDLILKGQCNYWDGRPMYSYRPVTFNENLHAVAIR